MNLDFIVCLFRFKFSYFIIRVKFKKESNEQKTKKIFKEKSKDSKNKEFLEKRFIGKNEIIDNINSK